MKNLILIVGSATFGYILNTETAKKLILKGKKIAEDKINSFVEKVNEVAEDKTEEKVES